MEWNINVVLHTAQIVPTCRIAPGNGNWDPSSIAWVLILIKRHLTHNFQSDFCKFLQHTGRLTTINNSISRRVINMSQTLLKLPMKSFRHLR